MKKILTVLYLLFGVIFLVYLSLPRPGFPTQPPDTLKSGEPADIEDVLRPSYFTDLDREGVLSYYKDQFTKSSLGVVLPTYRLNYPPEEAEGIIRERTRSSYLVGLYPGIILPLGSWIKGYSFARVLLQVRAYTKPPAMLYR